MRRLDIGCASYGKPEKLARMVKSLQDNSTTDWQLMIVSNPHPIHDTRELIAGMADQDSRIVPIWLPENRGYSGAVNTLLNSSTTEMICYIDDDAVIQTRGWDETLCGYLDRFHELGLVAPNGGAYGIKRGGYMEVLWAVGFCWVLSRVAMRDVGLFDESLGHQDEVDYQTRLRLAGYRIGAAPEVAVRHDAVSSNDPASIERISRGVINWVNKWTAYFGGKNINYHSPNVIRFEDWDCNRLYMEEWFKEKLPGLNDNPETVTIEGREYDLIKVPHFKDFYRGRII